jgi:orotate phosphoribosyltransferase
VLTLQDFRDTGALLTGHFRLSSGRHSDQYLQCARLLMWPERAERAGSALAEQLRPLDPDVVISPALGGIVIGHETAKALKTPAVFAERQDGVFTFRRGFTFAPGARAVVVEDVLTTGQSTRETIEAAQRTGARVVGVGAIVDRGLPAASFAVPHRALLSLEVPSWPESECPLCRSGVALEAPGSRFKT